MSERRLIIASGVVAMGLTSVATAALSRLPAGTQLPVHWNAAGEADRLADAGWALFLPVALTLIIGALLVAIPRVEPLQSRSSGSRGLLETSWIALLCAMVGAETMIAAPAFDVVLPAAMSLLMAGGLLIAIGNALPKSRPGFFIGIRTPWTLIDTDNWIATHRLGARLMVAAGAVMIVAAVIPVQPATRSALVIAALAIAVVVPVVFSYLHWRRAGRLSRD